MLSPLPKGANAGEYMLYAPAMALGAPHAEPLNALTLSWLFQAFGYAMTRSPSQTLQAVAGP